MKKSFIAVITALVISAAVIWATTIGARTALSIKNKGKVSVKGFAKKEIESDLGIFKATLVTEDIDLKTCYKNLENDKNTLKTFLGKLDFSEEQLVFYPVQIKEKYKVNASGFETEEFLGYKLSQDFKIQDSDVKKISQLSEKISQLVGEGMKLLISSPTYLYTKLDELKVEMIGEAAANAYERAMVIAQRGKFHLGPVSSVRTGIFQITPLYSNEVSDYGMNDVSSIDKEIKSVVDIDYFVQ